MRFRNFERLDENQLAEIKKKIGYVEKSDLPSGAQFLYNGPTGVLYRSTDDLVESAKNELNEYLKLSKMCGKDAKIFVSAPSRTIGMSENELMLEGIFGIYCSSNISPYEIVAKMEESMPRFQLDEFNGRVFMGIYPKH